MGKRDFPMFETITAYNPPETFAATYEAEGVVNLISNRFTETADGKTRWLLESQFTFRGLMMKVIAFFMPATFRKQTLTFMQRFKEFAEKSIRAT